MEKRRLSKKQREERNKTAAETLRKVDGRTRRIIIDCSFGHIMTPFERSSLVVQIQQCYSHLRNFSRGDIRMVVAACDEILRGKILKQGGDQWVVDLSEDPIEVMLESLSENVIVMSPDAAEELSVDEAVCENSVFIIGGIVDRLVSRNETSHKALKLGLKARRLPVDADKFINKVFNIDSVFEFLLKAKQVESREEMINVLLSVLPERKKRESVSVETKKVKKPEVIRQDPCNTIKLDRYSLEELFR